MDFINCGKQLNQDEIKYYIYRCEECEQVELIRYKAWLAGAEDNELDKLYGV